MTHGLAITEFVWQKTVKLPGGKNRDVYDWNFSDRQSCFVKSFVS